MPRPPDSARPRPRADAGDGAHEDTRSIGHGAAAGEPPLLLDRRCLARALGVSVRELDRMRSRGALPPPLRLGRSPRWRREDVVAWLAGLARRAEGRP